MAKFSFHKVPAEKRSLLKQNNHEPYGISLFYKQQNHFCQSSRMCCVQHRLVCTYTALCSTQAGLSVLLLKLVFSGAEQARFPSHHLHGIKSFLKWKLSTFFYKFVFFPFSRKGYLYCLFFSHIWGFSKTYQMVLKKKSERIWREIRWLWQERHIWLLPRTLPAVPSLVIF